MRVIAEADYTELLKDILREMKYRVSKKVGAVTYCAEMALYHALKRHCEAIAPFLADPYYFHRAFRQSAVTGTGDDDMVIWFLLQGNSSFWEVFVEKFFKDTEEEEEGPSK